MPKNSKPPPHGPSPIGNITGTTDLQEFAAPSTILDREILEGLSAGSSGFKPDYTAHESKESREDDSPLKNKDFLGEAVELGLTDLGFEVVPGPEFLEARSLSVSRLQNVLLPDESEISGGKDLSAKIEAPIEEGFQDKQTAKTEAPKKEDLGIQQTAKTEAPIKEGLGIQQTGNNKLPS